MADRLQTGYLYAGPPRMQQRAGFVVSNPATNTDQTFNQDPATDPEFASHIGEIQRQHNAYLRNRTSGAVVAPGAAPVTAATIAANAGFPLAGAAPAPAAAVPAAALAPGPAAALKAPSVGTTEIVPGMMDWIRQLVVDALPSRAAAAAAPVAAPAGPGLGAINAPRPAAQAPMINLPWYERAGLVPSSQPQQVRPDGVRG